MSQKNLPHDKFNAPLSQKMKVKLGIDTASFMKRMKARLRKIRGNGEEDMSEAFLVKHNYYKYRSQLV